MIGEKLGSFVIESVLGSGAMGVVYKAIHEPSGRIAAVKVISGEVGQKGKGFERFEREAEILQQFRHPNIVRFLAVGRSKGTSYFAMEFVPGTTLDHLLSERGPLPWKEVAELGLQVCEALHYAHEHGVVHRDLKPSNLMVTEDGKIKLADFGIAKDLDATALTATGRTLGTAAYMAPEQIRGTPAVSHKTDLYALGVVLYQLLTGRLAFDGTSALALMHAHMSAPAPRASEKVAEIPRALDDLVLQLMAKDPADRPWDAAAVAESLKTVLDKANRGENVRMVWPTQDAPQVQATNNGGTSLADVPGRPRKKSSKARGGKRVASEVESSANIRHWLEIGGMVLALAAIAGVMAYLLWPPSASYLYKNAERLMASKDRHDWYTARDEYIGPLDRRFPNHPHKSQTAAWRDQIITTDTEARARTLASPVQTALSRPQNQNEQRFVEFHARATAAEKAKDDLRAAEIWDEMAAQLRAGDPEERPWYLLATKRAGESRKVVEERQALVKRLVEEVAKAEDEGRPAEAQALRNRVLTQYGAFVDVARLLELPIGGPPSPGTPAPPPPEKPAEDGHSTGVRPGPPGGP